MIVTIFVVVLLTLLAMAIIGNLLPNTRSADEAELQRHRKREEYKADEKWIEEQFACQQKSFNAMKEYASICTNALPPKGTTTQCPKCHSSIFRSRYKPLDIECTPAWTMYRREGSCGFQYRSFRVKQHEAIKRTCRCGWSTEERPADVSVHIADEVGGVK